jgi:hypothetical protein
VAVAMLQMPFDEVDFVWRQLESDRIAGSSFCSMIAAVMLLYFLSMSQITH